MTAHRRGDYQAVFQELRRLAESGMPEAQHVLGVMYADGRGGAEDGSYSVGDGIDQDYVLAYMWCARNGRRVR